MLKQQLQKLGLSNNEAKIYLAALELGDSTVIRIAKKADIPRGTAYGPINNLRKKGYISTIKRGQKTFYIAESPNKLINTLKQKIKITENILPELLSIMNIIDKKPKIKFYEGKEAIEEIHNDTLNYPGQDYVTWISELGFYQHFEPNYWYNFYMPERIKKKIFVRSILTDHKESRKFRQQDQKFLRQTRLDHDQKHIIDVIILVYGKNKIGIISTDEVIGLIIESRRLNITMRTLFEVHWHFLEKL